ncbi:MAG: pyruvate formate-lyase-activating protein [Lentisphaeria bacterium]|nr:pyruvate formate-lyase-activating protein [Lentisphaeria bacterium]
MTTGRVHSYETLGALDGPGLRLVIFLQGCPLRCCYCHNPDTWDVAAGQPTSVADISQRITRFMPYFGHRGGVTLSGGEPLLQAAFCVEILRECRRLGVHSAIDTGGGVWNDVCRQAADLADIVILDIKAANAELWQAVTGRDGFSTLLQLIADFRASQRPVWIRQVVAKGLNDRPKAMRELAALVAGLNCERVELLPYHEMGRSKWEKLGLDYAAKQLQPPMPALLADLEKVLAALRGG